MAIKDYLIVDIAKPVNTYANLTDYFQGRVGDAEAYCKLWIKFGTRPVDMTGKKLRFEGNDPNNTPFVDAGRFDAGDDGDVQLGMITFYFPKGIFQVEGTWQHAYFKLQDQNGSDISTIDLQLNVLPNNVEMGITIHPFEPDLEKVKAQINQALREMNAQQLLNQIDSMKNTVGAYTDLITRNQILNKPDTIKLINDQVGQELTKLDSKFSTLSGQVNNSVNDLGKKLDNAGFKVLHLGGTMLNNCGGWVSSYVYYNNVVALGRIFGYVELPEGSKTIDFATNPLNGKVDFNNSTLTQTVTIISYSGGTRFNMLVDLDQNNTTLGLWNSAGYGDNKDQTNAKGNFKFSIMWNAPAGVVKG